MRSMIERCYIMNHIINKAAYKPIMFSKMVECLKNRINIKF
jgi:hypothetical protein